MKTFSKLLMAVGRSYAALHLARTVVRYRRVFDWQHKRVVVTGGSRGLGLVIARLIARLLADRDARLAICAQTEESLQTAAMELRSRGAEVICEPCDVRDSAQVNGFIDRVANQWDGVDVLFNVAGIITVGPLKSMTVDDFQDSMQTNCFGALHTVLAVLPLMRQQHWGRIVNVASIGGKRAVPHMLPYSASGR